jgi:hypothetical protein
VVQLLQQSLSLREVLQKHCQLQQPPLLLVSWKSNCLLTYSGSCSNAPGLCAKKVRSLPGAFVLACNARVVVSHPATLLHSSACRARLVVAVGQDSSCSGTRARTATASSPESRSALLTW